MTHFCQRSDESSFFSRWFGLCTSENLMGGGKGTF